MNRRTVTAECLLGMCEACECENACACECHFEDRLAEMEYSDEAGPEDMEAQ